MRIYLQLPQSGLAAGRLVLSGACGVALCLLPALPGQANDTTLNVNVNPPQQLSQYYDVPVRMASEHISIHFGRERSQVEVEFTFEDQSEYGTNFSAGFPDEDLLARYAYFGPQDPQGRIPGERFANLEGLNDFSGTSLNDNSVLTDFQAWTRPADAPESANQPLETQLLKIARIAYVAEAVANLGGDWTPADPEFNTLMFCHAFHMFLDAGERRIVGHSYSTLNGSNVESQQLFSYTLATGGTWAGTIGSTTVDAYLLDGLTAADLHLVSSGEEDYAALCNPAGAGWEQLAPDHLRFTWTDYNPEGDRGYVMLATQPKPPPSE